MKKVLKRMVKSTICLALVLMFTFSFSVFFTINAQDINDVVLDDFESYADSSALSGAYTLTGGTMELDASIKKGGSYSMKYNYIEETEWQYFEKGLAAGSLIGRNAMEFWVNANDVAQTIYFMLVEASGEMYYKGIDVSGSGWQLVRVPFSQMVYKDISWIDGIFDIASVNKYQIGLTPSVDGSLNLDNIGIVKERLIDNFDSYADSAGLQSNWIQDPLTIGVAPYDTLLATPVYGAGYNTSSPNSMRFYVLNYKSPYYFRTVANNGMPLLNMDTDIFTGIELMVRGDGSKNFLILELLNETNGWIRWDYNILLDFSGWRKITVPLYQFVSPENPAYDIYNMDINDVTFALAIGTNYSAGPFRWVTDIYVDDIKPLFGSSFSLTNARVNSYKTISNITVGSTVQALINDMTFYNLSSCVVKNSSGVTISDYNSIAKTGNKIEIVIGGGVYETYKTIIYGDVDGDGIIDLNDLVNLKSDLLNITKLQGVFKKAASINNGTTPTISDLLSIKKHILNISSIVQH